MWCSQARIAPPAHLTLSGDLHGRTTEDKNKPGVSMIYSHDCCEPSVVVPDGSEIICMFGSDPRLDSDPDSVIRLFPIEKLLGI